MTAPADVKSIFGKALERTTAAERAAYLDEACAANPALRSEVEGLLNALEQAGHHFMAPAASPLVERPGAVIGPYKLLQEMGEGGMGSVFLAEQAEPVRRKVALKIIKPGLDSRQVIARFEAERQALALMDHPNIAKVLDAGTTASGRPYFVMELVKGVSITAYCDENRLTPRQRLELFVPVCQAIQHAHQKGIIHRDVKPSNVLVALYDGKPVPKVIDFGIAKATDQHLTEKTLFTKHGQIVGTFEYMSPEQATLDSHDVDTRSDIYSLGVLLYELLTGTTPLDKERLRGAALLEALRLIREEEPPRPSARLSESRGALVLASVHRQTDADKLLGLMAGELDWIVMKSLDKDRARRYATAAGMALDVEHYLKDEPVEACPPTAGYRLRKFVRRNKASVLTAAVVLAALVAGVVGTTWGMVDALAARQEETRQRQAADVERQAAEEQRNRAVAAEAEAQKNETKAEWRLYASQIALAQKAWESNDVPLLYHYLKQCRPDFRGWEHDYLFTLVNTGHQVLSGHTGSLFDVAFSPDGTVLASAGGTPDKGEILLWDARSGKFLRSLSGHASWVRGIAFSPDGTRLATAAGDKSVKVWDVASGKNVLTLGGHQGTVWKAAFSPDGKRLASVSAKGELKLWDAISGEEKASLVGHATTVYGVAFSPDGKLLASASTDKTVKLWDLATDKEMRTLPALTNMIYARLAFSRDGKLLVCRTGEHVKLWDTESWNELRPIAVDGTGGTALSPDGKFLANGEQNNAVKLLDIASGREVRALKAHSRAVLAVAYSPDGKRLASGSADKTVRLWDLDGGAEAREVRPSKGFPKAPAVARSRDGSRLAKVTETGSLQVLDAASGKSLVTLEEKLDKLSRLAFSPDGKRLAGIVSENVLFGFPVNDELKVWNVADGKMLGAFKCDLVSNLAFSPDGILLAAVSTALYDTQKGNDALLWNLESGKKTVIANGPENAVRTLAFSPDGRRLAIAWDTRLWDIQNKGKSPKNSQDVGQIHLWHTDTQQRYAILKGHTDAVQALAFHSDGKRLASGSRDKTIRLWDLAGGETLRTLSGHTKEIRNVTFSPDGKRLASAADDRTVKLWDVASGQEVLSLSTNVANLAFSPDGKRLSAITLSSPVVGAQPSVTATWDASKSMTETSEK